MVGLTRFFCWMNLCEKTGVLINVYRGLLPFKKHADFRDVKKLFVLQEIKYGESMVNMVNDVRAKERQPNPEQFILTGANRENRGLERKPPMCFRCSRPFIKWRPDRGARAECQNVKSFLGFLSLLLLNLEWLRLTA